MVQCPSCGTTVPPRAMVLSMKAQFDQVCQGCAAAEQRTSTKAGTSKAYLTGALIVGLAIGAFLIRMYLRMH